MSLNAFAISAAEATEEAAVNPWVVGAIVLGFLLFALLVVVAIGGGREHS